AEHLRGERIGKILRQLLECLVRLDGVLQKRVELLIAELSGGRFHGGSHRFNLIRFWRLSRSRRQAICTGTTADTAPRAPCTSRRASAGPCCSTPASLPFCRSRPRRRRRRRD